MSDFLIYMIMAYMIIAAILIVVSYGIHRIFVSRNSLQSNSGIASKTMDSPASGSVLCRRDSEESSDPGYTLTPEGEAMTRALIGDDTFETMKFTVENILKRHKDDNGVTISLTSGCESAHASSVLHSLLPGDELSLVKNEECGLEMIDVYAAGYRVGRLLLGDADIALSVMRDNTLTGAYVAEQNCYGDCNIVDMKIILFFSPRASIEHLSEKDTPYKITIDGVKPIVIFQN